MENSFCEVDGPPSSPFVSQITETNSRAASKQYDGAALTPLSEHKQTLEDKENTCPATTLRQEAPYRSNALDGKQHGGRTGSNVHTDLMPPPPTTIKSPKRAPLTQTRDVLSVASPSAHASPRSKQLLPHSSSPPSYPRPYSRSQTEQANIDDTCFSTFSEVHDLTWNRTERSPSKLADISNGQRLTGRDATITTTPRSSRKRASPSRSPSPTPRRMKTPGDSSDPTSTLLIDFTQQMENVGKPKALPSSRTEPNLLQHLQNQRSPAKTTRHSLATPAKPNSILDLLDFELPPAPTPRSVPTITVRELETLKSQYLSQISSLKATLNGREAEVESFKRAIGDAERRVGEAQEALREEKIRREQAEQEKLDWERRGLEVENVLKTVREEILRAEAEKDELIRHVDDCEQRLEVAEAKATRAEEKLVESKAINAIAGGSSEQHNLDEQVQQLVATQIDAKIEAVSRELHAVYKEKHERKVATLKQSYEARSQKRMAELQSKVSKLERANDELLVANAALVPLPPGDEGDNKALALLKTQMEEQKAHLARVQEELVTSKSQRGELVRALEQERIEKGDLVAAVDEMLALQAEQGPTQGAMSVVEDFRKSISRPPSSLGSGLKQPTESRPSRMPQYSRTPAGKSKMLASIERMGRTASHEG